MNHLKKVTVNENATLKEAMASIDSSGAGQVLVLDEHNTLIGIASDGDIRRSLMKGESISTPVKKIINTNCIVLQQSDLFNASKIHETINALKNRLKTAQYIPIVDDGKLVEFAYIKNLHQFGKVVSFAEVREEKKVNRVLIIGGAGYLGSILSRKLLDRRYDVRVFDIMYFGEQPIEDIKDHPHFELIKGDMRNIAEVTKSLVGVDAVILLAGVVGDPACQLSPEETVETNYLATKMVAEACKYHQINRFIFASTASVYGVQEGVVDETSPLHPVSLYARSKIMSEEAILSLIDENFSPTMLRMGTLYGLSPRMRFDLVINVLTMKAAKEGKIKIFGGKQWRPFLHVDDAAEAYIKALEAPIEKVKGEVFNVGSDDQNCQIQQLGEYVKQSFPSVMIETVPEDVDQRDYRVSSKKIEHVLNFSVQKTIPYGIEEIKHALRTIENPLSKVYYNS